LELDGQSLDPQIIKKAYRRLSLKYHPDVSQSSDGSKFILINAAYEYLIKNLPYFNAEEFRETEDELNNRIASIRKAFQNIRNDYYNEHNSTFEKMVDELIFTLDSYTSHKRLREGINNDFPKIVEKGINRIVQWFDLRISVVVSSYDDWINGYLRSTYQKLLQDEFSNWYKSKYFYMHFIISSIVSMLFAYYFYFEDILYIGLSIVPLLIGISTYRMNVKNKYSYKANIKTLDSSRFKINPSKLFVTNNDSASIGEAAFGLGSIGALIGLFGGPIGALLGGAVGGLLGSLFGESVDELKSKLFDRLIEKLKEVEDLIFQNLEDQIPKIEEELISTIKNNFNKNKEHAVKLLLQAKSTK